MENAELLKEDERTSVFGGEASVGPVVVKTMRVDRLKDRASAVLGRTRLMRQWDGWEVLRPHGIESPDCYALVRDGDVETLVMRRVWGKTLLRHIEECGSDLVTRRKLCGVVADFLDSLEHPDAFLRDGKPSNLIVSDDFQHLWAIDTVDVRRGAKPEDRLKQFAMLLIEPIGLGHSVAHTDRLRVLRDLFALTVLPISEEWDTGWKKNWRAVEKIIEAHDDPRVREKLTKR
ncbi:MAG: hypothetical protein RLN60_00915 [Phycisphaerales bacterium]